MKYCNVTLILNIFVYFCTILYCFYLLGLELPAIVLSKKRRKRVLGKDLVLCHVAKVAKYICISYRMLVCRVPSAKTNQLKEKHIRDVIPSNQSEINLNKDFFFYFKLHHKKKTLRVWLEKLVKI